MKFATFVAQVQDDRTITIPLEVRQKLQIEPGDRVEISLKKIKSGRLELLLSENPLYRLINMSEMAEPSEES